MATLTITQDLKSGASDLVSVHNFNKLKWTFVPTDDTKAITSEVTIGTYTFNGIQTGLNTGTAPDTYSYELDVSEILKYFANTFVYKLITQGTKSDLVKAQTISITGLEDASVTDTENLTIYLSHGVKQIGDDGGGNMVQLYSRADINVHYFEGYPFDFHFYLNAALTTLYIDIDSVFYDIYTVYMAEIGLFPFKFNTVPSALNTIGSHQLRISDDSAQLVTAWTNGGGAAAFDTFTSTGRNITSAIEASGTPSATTNTMSLTAGDILIVEITLTLNVANIPYLILSDGTNPLTFTLIAGLNRFVKTVAVTGTYTMTIGYLTPTSADFIMSLNYIYKNTRNQVVNINTMPSVCEGLYVRYLSREGFYRYWLFNKYFRVESDRAKIGSMVNYIDTMIAAQGRTKNIGYKNSFKRYVATSENVSKDDQKILMDIFDSPSVYVYITKRYSYYLEAFNETIAEFATKWTLASGTAEASIKPLSTALGGQYLSIGNNSGNDMNTYYGNQSIPFDPTRLYKVEAKIRRTAGTGLFYIGIAGRDAADNAWVNTVGANAATSSQHYFAASGYDPPDANWVVKTGYFKGVAFTGNGALSATITSPGTVHEDVKFIRPFIRVNYNAQAGTSDIDYIEISMVDREAVWVMAEVEGSHTIKEKKNFDTVSAAFVLPESYTQKL